jgi:hypothetical protein
MNTGGALPLDKENRNTLWADAIAKEMAGLDCLGVFKYHSVETEFKKDEGWQWAPLRMIFDIKQMD